MQIKRYVQTSLERRKNRTRKKLRAQSYAKSKPRICVYKSCSYIYAQIIQGNKTLFSASSKEKEAAHLTSKSNCIAARWVGEKLAERSSSTVKEIIFDRGHYLFHGKIKALAEGAREKGLNF